MPKFHPVLAVFWAAGVVLLATVMFHFKMAAVKPTCYTLRDRVATVADKALWDELECEQRFLVPPDEIQAAVAARPVSARIQRDSFVNSGTPLVGIVVYASSEVFRPNGQEYERRISFQVDAANMPLYKLFKSIGNTVEKGFAFAVYVVYDAEDEIYDGYGKISMSTFGGPGTHSSAVLERLFDEFVRVPAGMRDATAARFAALRFDNRLALPGPAVNFGAASAIADGCDYVLIAPEDVSFQAKWAFVMTAALSRLEPPNVGAVGLSCVGCVGAADKETLHAPMVHRAHFEAFQHMYPAALTYGCVGCGSVLPFSCMCDA